MKKIRNIRIHLIDDNTGEEGILSVQREFDENGRLTSDTRYYDGSQYRTKYCETV
jgi:hypothetical protein